MTDFSKHEGRCHTFDEFCQPCVVATIRERDEAFQRLGAIHRVAREALKGVEQGDEGIEMTDTTPEGAVKSAIAVQGAQIKRVELRNRALLAWAIQERDEAGRRMDAATEVGPNSFWRGKWDTLTALLNKLSYSEKRAEEHGECAGCQQRKPDVLPYCSDCYHAT